MEKLKIMKLKINRMIVKILFIMINKKSDRLIKKLNYMIEKMKILSEKIININSIIVIK